MCEVSRAHVHPYVQMNYSPGLLYWPSETNKNNLRKMQKGLSVTKHNTAQTGCKYFGMYSDAMVAMHVRNCVFFDCSLLLQMEQV